MGRKFEGGHAVAMKKYMDKNKEKIRQKKKEYYQKNREYLNARSSVRKYYKIMEEKGELTEVQKIMYHRYMQICHEYPNKKNN